MMMNKGGVMEKTLVVMLFVICTCLVILIGCDFAESHLVKEQAITFEQEIAYRQRKELELEGKLRKANEQVEKLEAQLQCKEVTEKKKEKGEN